MKRLLVVFLAVFVGLTFVSGVYAQAVTETKGTTPKTEAAAKTEKHIAQQAPGPCKQILVACKNAGFVIGEWEKGYGLYRDCVDPIMQGKTKVPGAIRPLPAVDPKLVAECKAKNPSYGSGKVGSKK